MRKRSIHNWVSKIAWTFVLFFPLFHYFFFGLASANQNPTALGAPIDNLLVTDYDLKNISFDSFMFRNYSWTSPFLIRSDIGDIALGGSFGVRKLFESPYLVIDNSVPVPLGVMGYFGLGVVTSDLSSAFSTFLPDSFGVYCMINWIVYVVCIRLLLAVFLFIPKFATKLLNRFSADDEVIL